jgi:hypothetical protein
MSPSSSAGSPGASGPADGASTTGPPQEWVVADGNPPTPPTTAPTSAPVRVRMGRGKWTLLGVALALLVVVALILAGVVPGVRILGGGTSPPAPVGVSEQTAAAIADRKAANVSGGPWSLAVVTGFDPTLGLEAPYDLGCPLNGREGVNLSIGGTNGSYEDGHAPAWVFEYHLTNASAPLLFLEVENGSAIDLGVPSSSCRFAPSQTLASGLIDSTAAARTVASTPYGAAYIASHATSNATYSLYVIFGPRSSPITASWEITFSGCSGWNYTTFDSEVNASDGDLLRESIDSLPSDACGEPRALGSSLTMSPGVSSVGTSANSSYCQAGDQCYSVQSYAYSDPELLAADLQLRVQYVPSGSPYLVGAALGVGLSIVDPNGTVLASGGAPTAAGQPLGVSQWTDGASTVLYGPFTVWVDLGTTASPQGQGLELVASGVTPYYGTVTAKLP